MKLLGEILVSHLFFSAIFVSVSAGEAFGAQTETESVCISSWQANAKPVESAIKIENESGPQSHGKVETHVHVAAVAKGDVSSFTCQSSTIEVPDLLVANQASESLPLVREASERKLVEKAAIKTSALEQPLSTAKSTTDSAAHLDEDTVKRFAAFRKRDGKLKVALALGGGGMRGAAHVGVLKVLEEEKIPFDLVVGTSMGAIVGGFYCAGMPVSEIEKMFRKGALMKAYMTMPVPVRLVTMPIMLMPRLVYHPYDGLYWGVRFRRFLNKKLPDNTKNIEDLKFPFAAVAVDLTEGTPHTISRGLLTRALQASSAVPGLRKPVQIGEHLFVDGGVLSNIPVEQAVELGCDVVIAVNVDERLERAPLNTFRKMGSVSKRILTLQLELMDREHVSNACITIHPEVTGIGLLSTKKADALRAMKEGETAARQAIPTLRKCLREAGVDI